MLPPIFETRSMAKSAGRSGAGPALPGGRNGWHDRPVDKMILFDADGALWMLPRGGHAISFAPWHDSRPRLHEFVESELLRRGVEDVGDGLDVVVALVRRPDNTYNRKAISVAQPPAYGGSPIERHMGYVYDRNHDDLGGELFHDLARAGLSAEIGCHARLVRDYRDITVQLLLPGPQEVNTLIQEFLRHERTVAERELIFAVLAARTSDHVPPARVIQTALLEERAEPYVSMWCESPPRDAATGSVRVQQRAVFGNRMVYVINQVGGRVGQLRDDTLFLTDERYRRAALPALAAAGFPQPGVTLSDWYPDAVVVEQDEQWYVRTRDDDSPMGRYERRTGTLYVYADAYLEPAEIMLRRYGVEPAVTRSAPPETNRAMNRQDLLDHKRSQALVEQQHLRMWKHHRALLPADLADLSPMRWTRDEQDKIFARDDTLELHEDAYYLEWLEAVFGPNDHGTYRKGQRPVPCRLCGRDAIAAKRLGEPGAQPLAYCKGCTNKAARGYFFDHGEDQPWMPVAVWALQQIAVDLGGPPSTAQIPRLVSTANPAAADRATLIRIHVPRIRRSKQVPRRSETRAPLVWVDWLHRAELVGEGMQTARGTVNVATDGHRCRSLLERHIDDFLHANGIVHDIEPNWPYDAELNTTGLRADWLLTDGTYVEAWGLPSEAYYRAKMSRKAELANRRGIRLIGVTATDLGRLHEIFAGWLTRSARPVPMPTSATPAPEHRDR